MEDPRILVVEDEWIVAKNIQEYLETLGYTVTSIEATGDKAVKKIQENKPDLVLMDIVLPGEIDGIEAWSKPLEDGTTAIALFNREDKQRQISFDYHDLKLDNPPGILYDLWLKKEIKISDKEISYEIPPHGVVLFKTKM